jgi:hypothetical protein
MKRVRVELAVLLVLAGLAAAQEALPLHVAQGVVEKVDKESLTVQPRGEGGKLGKAILLKITGTSKITAVGTRDSGGKTVVTQRDLDAKDLRPKQAVAVTYTTTKDGNVLLSAVAQPAEK